MAQSGVKITWHGRELSQLIRNTMGDRLQVAADELAGEIHNRITQAQSPPTSAPGAYPHMDTGALAAGLYTEVDRSNLSALVANREDHALYLELGTSRMAPRPHMRRTMADMRNRIYQILAAPIPALFGPGGAPGGGGGSPGGGGGASTGRGRSILNRIGAGIRRAGRAIKSAATNIGRGARSIGRRIFGRK